MLAVAKEQASTATSAAEVAEARLKSTQGQLGKANDAAAAAQDRVQELELAVQVGSHCWQHLFTYALTCL
jgi:hypothetical protein